MVSRKIKNIIMITVILIVCILSYFTMSGAVKSTIPDNSFEKEFGGTLPNFNNGEFSEENMPERPSGNFENGEMPNLENLPENFKNGQMPNLENLPENFENGEMPNMENLPENFEGSFKGGNFSKEDFKVNISGIYYILFFVEGLIVSLLLIYLIMSNFNSKTLKETLSSGRKIVVFVILSIIITIGLTVTQAILAKNVFQTNNMIQIENI